MRISDWRSDVCSSDLASRPQWAYHQPPERLAHTIDAPMARQARYAQKTLNFRPGAGAAPRGDRPIGLLDRKSDVEGKSVSVRVDLGGLRILKKKQKNTLDQDNAYYRKHKIHRN